MMAGEASLTVGNAMPEVLRAAAWLDTAARAASVPADIAARLQLALDELLSNVILHGLAGAAPGTREIGLALRREGGKVVLELVDDGPEFDPGAAALLPRAQRIAERRIGGAGLVFVRALMDEVRFARRDGHNHVSLLKHLPERF